MTRESFDRRIFLGLSGAGIVAGTLAFATGPASSSTSAAGFEIRRSDADWTVVRPPQLTDRPPRGRYRVAVDRHLDRGWRIPRADLATAMLRLLEDPSSLRAAVAVAS